jgi:hypothetical protein
MRAKTILLAVIFSAALGFSTLASAAPITVTVTPASPTTTARVTRNGVVSDCLAAKPFPGTIAGTFGYAVSSAWVNPSSQPACVAFTLTTSAVCSTEVFGTAYLGSFNPASLATNYLGDAGASSASTTFQAFVPGNASVVFALMYTTSTPADTCTMSIVAQPLIAEPTPVLDPRLLSLLGLLVAAAGWVWLRRAHR